MKEAFTEVSRETERMAFLSSSVSAFVLAATFPDAKSQFVPMFAMFEVHKVSKESQLFMAGYGGVAAGPEYVI